MTKTDSTRAVYKLLFALSIIIILCHAFSFLSKKEGYFIDETLSFQLANNSLTSFSELSNAFKNENMEEVITNIKLNLLGTNTWKTHDEVMAKYTVSEEDRFDYFNTYLLQVSDVHPPLYYFTIKTVCSFFPNMDLKFVGFVINMVCLLLTLLFVYKISIILFNNNLISITVLLYYGLSFDFINNITYFRMYAMLTFWMVLSVYLNLQWYRSGFNNDKKTITKLCIVLYCSMLTQYFALFFCFPIFALNIYLIAKNQKPFGRYLKYCIITCLFYLITWPASIFHIFFSYRSEDLTRKLGIYHIIQNLIDYLNSVVASLFASSHKYFIGFVILLMAFTAYKIFSNTRYRRLQKFFDSERTVILLYVSGSAIIYFFIASVLAPWYSDRYIMPVMPLLCIIIICILSESLSVIVKNKTICTTVLLILSVVLCIRWHIKSEPYYLYNSPERLQYLNNCTQYDAVIIDKEFNICNCYVEFNVVDLSK